MAEAIVEVKSTWLSKINWTQTVGLGATILTIASGNRYSIPPEVQLSIVAGIQSLVAIATWILKTWWSPTVTAGSIK